jgi:hypothetical protein
MGLVLSAAMACSGCGATSRWAAPARFQGAASANPLPSSYSQPPVEPPPAPPASAVVEAPLPEPAPALQPDPSETTVLKEEVDQLKSEVAALRSQQEQSQSALESLTASSMATASRAAAIEAHLALQSSLIDDLRTATQQQQQQQWKALDAVSEGIDRMLKKSGQEPAAKPAPVSPPTSSPPVSPGEIPLEEILSQEPGASNRRKL